MLEASVLQQTAEQASGTAALGVDWVTLLVYVANFLMLLVLLRVLAYKPVMRMLDSRAERVRSGLEEADRVRREAQEQQAAMQRTLDEGRQASQRVLAEAREAAERYREQQAAQARAEAESMMERAREEIRRERDAALEQVRAEFAGLAVTAAERIIRRSLDKETHKDLIDEVLSQDGAVHSQG